MLKRSILKRVTRLGLAFYSMVWSMSFTVCASEYPLAELAVSDKVGIVSETDFNEEGPVIEETSSEIPIEETDAEALEEPSVESDAGSSDAAEYDVSAEN